MELSADAQKVLLRIYIGQNIRDEGILQSEVKNKETEELLARGIIEQNHWHLPEFKTTNYGTAVASEIVNAKIDQNRTALSEKLRLIPEKVIGFFNRRYLSKKLNFSTERGRNETFFYSDSWADAILFDSRIWFLWNAFFETLIPFELCTKTHYYVSTKGGAIRDYRFVICPEVRDFAIRNFDAVDFTTVEENTLSLYPFLRLAKSIVSI